MPLRPRLCSQDSVGCMKILLVEDEPKSAAYVRKGLRENGYLVDVAADCL